MTTMIRPGEMAHVAVIQAGEAARLAALASYHLLDTPPEPLFDRFTSLAARLLEAPVSLISLVDAERLWFKSQIGMDAQEMSRAGSFCSYAILQPQQVLVVENAAADPRFAAHPLVAGPPYIRFYAGAPIVAPDGHALGTLCIIDTASRMFSDEGRQSLSDLAAGIAALLELHRNVAAPGQNDLDRLTGLFSRRHFTNHLDLAIRRQGRSPSCGLICLGLDHFKLVNAVHGFATGDALLREAAWRIKASLRDGDVAARFGGDEFAVLLPGPVDAADAALVATRLMEALQAPFRFNGEVLPVSVSAGCAIAPDDAVDAETLMRCAHLALDDAKRSGRACLRKFSASRDQDIVRRQSLEADLLTAVAREAFHLVWQPIAKIHPAMPSQNRLIGFEALLRWGDASVHNPAYGPDQFIPVAEDMQLIRRIDCFVLRKACRAAAAWPDHRRVAVNVSGDWFRDDDLPMAIAATLRQTGLDPARLEIEITEGILIKDRDRGLNIIRQIKLLGVRVALDDFGSCYSSLSYVASFPFDKIKLDRAFVSELGRNPRAETITRAVLKLAEQLDTEVCAEGVETPEQLAFLSAEGCVLFQGYLIGRPARVPLAQLDLKNLK